MIKNVIGAVLIFVAGGAWLFLDCLNRQEQANAEQMHQGVVSARAEAKKRADIKDQFEKQILASFNNCQAAADKAKTDYASLIEQTAPRKRGAAVIPQEVSDAVEKVAAGARAECRQIYDNSLKSGS